MATKLKVGDEVLVDGQRCKITKLGHTGAAFVKAIDPPTVGKRLMLAVVPVEGVVKA